jgi:hypothetical protein
MLMPDQLIALAEMRREALERESKLHHLLAQVSQPPARWRQWTGGGLMWAGARLVQWGEGIGAATRRQRVELVN